MEIRIGLNQSARELSFETGDTAEAVNEAVTRAFSSEQTHLSMTDAKGNVYLVPSASISFVMIGTEETRRVGFVA